jgi:hypothetical protein
MREVTTGTGLSLGSPAVAPTKSNTQSYYDNFQGLTGAQDYAKQRAAQGYNNVMTDRYQQRSSQPYDGMLNAEMGTLGRFAQGPTAAGGLGGELASKYAGTDQIDTRLGERYNFANNATTTSDALGRLSRLNPSWNADSMGREVQNTDFGANAGSLSSRLSAGGTAGGQMISDIRSGNTQAGKFTDYLKGPDSASNQFLAGYSPNQTRALDSTYQKLAAQGPGHEEQFYTSLLEGGNPHYNQLKEDALRDARFSSAARGGFSSGMAVDNERRTISRLAADEFANRGNLAASAGNAQRARLGQELEGATALDSQLLGQNQLWAGTAIDREGLMSQGANSADSLRAGLAGDQDQLLGDLSKHRDTQGLERSKLASDLAKFSDTQGLERENIYLRGADQQDKYLRQDQDALDTLSKQRVDTDMDQDKVRERLALGDDTNRTNRMSDYSTALNNADQNRLTYNRDIDTLANNTATQDYNRDVQLDSLYGKGFDEQKSNEDRRLTAGTAADADMRSQDTNLINASKNASEEQRNAFRDKFDAAMAVGNAQAGMQMAYDMASIGALTEAELSSIDLQLGRAGVDSATRQAFVNNLMAVAGLGIKAKTGGAFS